MVMSDRQKSMPVAVIPCKLWNRCQVSRVSDLNDIANAAEV